ncbi:MFS transporter [Paenibacillus sp. TAB 01]|uniref:MFS transporter n=1 Tax=Paenibacillus sp. TAB 01 TaxID=3368988 RepID=UPI003752F356
MQGQLVDKFPKRNILLVTQSISMCLALTLSVLVFTDTVKYGYVMTIAFLLGLTNTFDMPTRQSFNIEIVGKEDLMNAIALNSTTFNLARIIGPAIGATMMALLGPAWCFLLNGLSFIAVIYGLLRIQTTPYVRQKKKNVGIFKEIKEGFVYISRDKRLSQTILLVTVVGTMAYNFNILIPVFTRDVLHLKEQTYGVLMSCLGVGSLIGALTMSLRSKTGPKMAVSITCSLLLSVVLILNGLATSPYVTGVLLAINGLCNILFATTCNSTLQMYSKDEYRSRVMSIYSLVFAGSTPVGSLFTGSIANHFGANGAFIACGLMCLIPCSVIILLYRRKPDSSPDAAGNQT